LSVTPSTAKVVPGLFTVESNGQCPPTNEWTNDGGWYYETILEFKVTGGDGLFTLENVTYYLVPFGITLLFASSFVIHPH
jgi:hypothetical protein